MFVYFFKIFSYFYGVVTNIRNFFFDVGVLKTYKSKLKVISIGNLVAGGSGKSPYVQKEVSRLIREGKNPVILSRGYGGKLSGPYIVKKGDSYLDVGDEPLMHALHFNYEVPVVVSKKRVLGAKYIEENKLGDVIVLDDAFQHRYLARDENICLVDVSSEKSVNDWLNPKLLPLGMFRENKNAGLKRATKVVFVQRQSSLDNAARQKLISSLPEGLDYEFVSFVFLSFIDVFSLEKVEIKDIKKDIFLLLSIAKPEPVYKAILELGFDVKDKIFLRDHAEISKTLIEDLQKRKANNEFSAIICTQKDAVKISKHLNNKQSVFSLSVDLQIVQ